MQRLVVRLASSTLKLASFSRSSSFVRLFLSFFALAGLGSGASALSWICAPCAMPSYNISIDDASPLWNFQPEAAWSDSSKSDPAYSLYANSTFHATQQEGASATLVFNGTAVYLYGARRGNHDDYTVSVDGKATLANGFADPDEFQVLLFSVVGLAPDQQHEMVLTDVSTDTSRPWVDVDFAVVTVGDGVPNSQSTDISLDDSAPNFAYSANWDDSNNGLQQYYFAGTMHRTNTNGASASITFHGNAVALYGATSSNHGNFSIALDGQPDVILSGLAPTFRPQQLLYFASNLVLADHTMTVTDVSPDTNVWLDLDRVVVSVWDTASGASSASASSPTSSATAPAQASATSTNGSTASPQNDQADHALKVSVIVGAIVGALALLLLIGGIVFVVLRLRKRRRERAFPIKTEGAGWTPPEVHAQTVDPYGHFGDATTDAGSGPRQDRMGTPSVANAGYTSPGRPPEYEQTVGTSLSDISSTPAARPLPARPS